MSKNNSTKKKARGSLFAIGALFCMLALTTYALVMSMVSVEDNRFSMGTVEIDLNRGRTIFNGSDINIEPGYSAKEDFTIENKGTADVFYRLYLENVTGSLQNVVIFEIYDGDKLLYTAKAKDFNKEYPCISSTPLAAGEKKTLTAVVKMPENAGNTYKTGGMNFDITADAVQAKNNSDKVFE